MNMIKVLGSVAVLASVSAAGQCLAATDNQTTQQRTVGNVHWQKTTAVNVNDLLAKAMPANTASIFFVRNADSDGLQTSANIGINDRFQVSLQPGNYSQAYTCAGLNNISVEVTGNKNNHLSNNNLALNLASNTSYFVAVDVDNQGIATLKSLPKDIATNALNNMRYQMHQISRVGPNCPKPIQQIPIQIAPVAPAIERPKKNELVELTVMFDTGKALIKPQYYPDIKQVADYLINHPNMRVSLEGHTDNKASQDYNLALSQQRVDAVKNVLINQFNIDSTRIQAIGYGASQPIDTNTTETGRQKNRRVVAVFKTN